MKEYRNGFGIAFRGLKETAEELHTLYQKGETRLAPEEIEWRRDAIKDIKKILGAIGETLDAFEMIAPPRVRTEPPKEKTINN